MTQTATEALIRQYFAAYETGDTDGMLACVADNVIHDVNQGGERRLGKHRYHAFLERMGHHYRETFTDLVVFVSGDGTRAAAEFNLKGMYVHTEDGMPPAHGQTYALPAGVFFAVADEQITRVTQYYNLTDWITQITAQAAE